MKKLLHVKLDELKPDPNQPRKDFDSDKLSELAGSIKAVGVKTAISIRKSPEGFGVRFMIIAGERRWKASKLAGKETIPAILVENEEDLSEDAIYAHQLTENLHRQDLNPVEKAEFIQERISYLKEKGVGNALETVANELGVSTSWVSKNTAILKYQPEVRALARDGRIRDYSLLKKISTLKEDKQQQAIELIKTGEFNAKDFFARKRYDKKTLEGVSSSDSQESKSDSEGQQQNKTNNKFYARLVLSEDEVVKLIEKTDYADLLTRHNPGWRSASRDEKKSYIAKFREWFTETEMA